MSSRETGREGGREGEIKNDKERRHMEREGGKETGGKGRKSKAI